MEAKDILFWTMTALVCILIFTVYQMDKERSDYIKNAIQSFKMYSADETIKNSNSSFGIDGIWYSNDNFYCVRYDAVSETDTIIHEKCHALIDNDYYHFCEQYFK